MTTTGAAAAAVCIFLLTIANSRQASITLHQLDDEGILSAIALNQRAILHLMEIQNASHSSEGYMEDEDEQADTKEWLERSLRVTMDALMQAQHQHLREVIEAVIKSSQESLKDFRDEMRRELKIVGGPQEQCIRPAADVQEEEWNVTRYSRFVDVVHNDSNPSLCHGDRTLVGTTGSLTVVKSGNYWPNTKCSWKLVFPRKSTVTMWWDYIDLEHSVNCSKDVVEVRDISQHTQPVYGRHCGIIPGQNLQQYNLIVHGTTSLLVSFKSDVAGERTGFSLQYHAH